jgi:UDP-2,3-diacylglucosamine pyrophosphatase LpxH
MAKMYYKTICISDTHLGVRDCKAELLANFLKHHKSDNLLILGDFLDCWAIQQKKWYWDKHHSDVIQKILKISKKTKVVYVVGNHDEILRPMIPYNIDLANISIVNQYEYTSVLGKRLLLTHGDFFDGISDLAPWLSFLGNTLYDMALSFNTYFNAVRRHFGFGYWSISKFLKNRVKTAVDFIFKFEENIVDYCIKRGYDGVCCGHIHNAEIKTINGIEYMNSGDFIESCTALVETHSGEWQIITWDKLL